MVCKLFHNMYLYVLFFFFITEPANSVKSKLSRFGIKPRTIKRFSQADIKYLIEKTNSFKHTDMFKEKFLTYLIRDRFKDRTQFQLSNKLKKLQMRFIENTNCIVTKSVPNLQSFKTTEESRITNQKPSNTSQSSRTPEKSKTPTISQFFQTLQKSKTPTLSQFFQTPEKSKTPTISKLFQTPEKSNVKTPELPNKNSPGKRSYSFMTSEKLNSMKPALSNIPQFITTPEKSNVKTQESPNKNSLCKKRRYFSKSDIKYAYDKTFNYSLGLIHDDLFLTKLIRDRFKDRTILELRSKLLELKNSSK